MSIIFEAPHAVIISHPRSGTHFLQASLASHPKIHGRGECVLRLLRDKQKIKAQAALPAKNEYYFTNKPNYINIAIVMYFQVKTFEALCGSLFNFKVIHLLRNPDDVALSVAQMQVNKAFWRSAYRAHHRIVNPPPQNMPFSPKRAIVIKRAVCSAQKKYVRLLSSHSQVLTISYEELTGNVQTTTLGGEVSKKLLSFLNLEYALLTNTLRKTGYYNSSS